MRSFPVLLVIVVTSSLIDRPSAHSLDCAYYCHSQYSMCESGCQGWDECFACAVCNEDCIASCTNNGDFEACSKVWSKMESVSEDQKNRGETPLDKQRKGKKSVKYDFWE